MNRRKKSKGKITRNSYRHRHRYKFTLHKLLIGSSLWSTGLGQNIFR